MFNSVQKWCAKNEKNGLSLRNICFYPRLLLEESDSEDEDEEGSSQQYILRNIEQSHYAVVDYNSRHNSTISSTNQQES